MTDPANILIVDDIVENLQVLGEMLRRQGYKVRPVTSGKLALQACAAQHPDLILLDITMPGMNGYEMCVALKQDEATRDIPVIFISALNESIDKVQGFLSGGVDYITKPFQIEEVSARVATQVMLLRRQNELRNALTRIRAMEESRRKVTGMIATDLRTPLGTIDSCLGELVESHPDLDAASREKLRHAHAACRKLMDMTERLTEINLNDDREE